MQKNNLEFLVENYLEKNVNIIEKGLQLIKRQYKVYFRSKQYLGIVDLLCQGKDGAYVIIELKSKPLGARDIGQVIGYYAAMKDKSEIHNKPNPRIYCIGPAVGLQYKVALFVLNNGKTINLNTKIFKEKYQINTGKSEIPIELIDYSIENEGKLKILR